MYASSEDLFRAIQKAFRDSAHVNFSGAYKLPEDPLISDRERVRMTIHDIWKITGYRFKWVFISARTRNP